MKELVLNTNPEVDQVFTNYPASVRQKMMALRELVIETAGEMEGVSSLEETLKWGEPSYLTGIGSTLRMDWKPKNPDQYALYFKCTSKLVETFKDVYGDKFKYEGNRAIVFQLDDPVPVKELKSCIRATLGYHRVKQLENLGITGRTP